MAPNLPPVITVNKNLAATLKAYVKEHGGKNVNESQLNQILQKVAKFDTERDNGTRAGGSIFEGGSKYFGGGGNDFKVKQGQQIQLSAEEFNEIFDGFIDPIKVETTTNLPEDPALPDPTNDEMAGITPKGTDTPPKPDIAGPVTNSNDDPNIKDLFPDGLPEGVSAAYVEIGGTRTLIFKKDGKTLDPQQLKEIVTKANEDYFADATAPQEATNAEMAGITHKSTDPLPEPEITTAPPTNPLVANNDEIVSASDAAKKEEPPQPTLARIDTDPNKDPKIKTLFPDGLPEEVTAEYADNNNQILIFKKDGKILDQKELKEIAAEAREKHLAATKEEKASDPALDNIIDSPVAEKEQEPNDNLMA